jgi:hypothetical protein
MIHYVSGDATYPELQRPDGVKLIVSTTRLLQQQLGSLRCM